MKKNKATKILFLLSSLFLQTSCQYIIPFYNHHGGKTCNQACKMTPDKQNYIYSGQECGAKDFIIPSDYVRGCGQCFGNEYYWNGRGMLDTGLTYPDFIPTKETSGIDSKAHKNFINIFVGLMDCSQKIDYKNSAEKRSEQRKEFINSSINSKYERYTQPKHLGKNLYVVKNYRKFNEQEIFYSKTPNDYYEFMIMCPSYGCHSSDEIEGTPYGYEYTFQRPSEIEDIVLIRSKVKDFITKIYTDGTNTSPVKASSKSITDG